MAKFVICLAMCVQFALVYSSPFLGDGKWDGRLLGKLSKSQLSFSSNFVRAVHKAHLSENTAVSPAAVYRFLTLLYLCSSGDTEELLSTALYLDWAADKDEVYAAYMSDVNVRVEENKYENLDLNIVDRLFIDAKAIVKDDFQAKFGDIIRKSNFQKNPEACLEAINTFIAEETQQKILSALSSNDVTAASTFVPTLAIYFKGLWAQEFNPRDNRTITFQGLREIGPVTMMMQTSSFKNGFSRNLNADILEMPYDSTDENIVMYFVMPQTRVITQGSFDSFIESLSPTTLQRMGRSLQRSTVAIGIPKMAFKAKYSLSGPLAQMGIQDLLGSSGEFGDLSDDSLSFNEVEHGIIMDVNEKGTEFEGYVAGTMRGGPDTIIFKKPFFFCVFDKALQQVLITGTYTKPILIE